MFIMDDEAQRSDYTEFTGRQIRAYFNATEVRKLYIQRVAYFTLIGLGVLAIIWLIGFITGSVPIAFVIFIGVLLLLLSTGSIILVIKVITQPFTDEEYDTWLEKTVREHYLKALEGMGIDASEDTEAVLYIHGFVLPGMRNAKKYRAEDILFKKGDDGKYRFSINIYTFYHPAQNRLAICIFDLNAVNHSDYTEATKEHFFSHIASTSVEDDQDTIVIAGQEYAYRLQSFALNSSDGKSVSATFSSKPVDNKQNLPTFVVSDSVETDATIKRLRKRIVDQHHNPPI